jgi:hypothetical protein
MYVKRINFKPESACGFCAFKKKFRCLSLWSRPISFRLTLLNLFQKLVQIRVHNRSILPKKSDADKAALRNLYTSVQFFN